MELSLKNLWKIFDTVEWSFLFKTLEKFNFRPQFIKWVKLLYHNPCALIHNGWVSYKIIINRGIRQGCPVSPLLFIIIADILANKLKQSHHKGTTVKLWNKKEMKLSQDADDICLSLKDDAQLQTVLKVIHNFGTLAGPKLNIKNRRSLFREISFWTGQMFSSQH